MARACYENAQIVLLDDPIAAVDANVGHQLVDCIVSGPLSKSTRILVTHSLECLPKADVIVVMDRDENNEGRIVQQGTYLVSLVAIYGGKSEQQDLMAEEGLFQTLMNDFGSAHSEKASQELEETGTKDASEDNAVVNSKKERLTGGAKFALDEDRNVGSVAWASYGKYVKAIGSWHLVAIVLFTQVMTQVCSIGTTLFLGFWSGEKLNLRMGEYMAIYAGLGGGTAFFVVSDAPYRKHMMSAEPD